MELDPLLVVFGVSNELYSLSTCQQKLLSKKRILQLWKKTETPSAKMWLEEMVNAASGNKICLIKQNGSF